MTVQSKPDIHLYGSDFPVLIPLTGFFIRLGLMLLRAVPNTYEALPAFFRSPHMLAVEMFPRQNLH